MAKEPARNLDESLCMYERYRGPASATLWGSRLIQENWVSRPSVWKYQGQGTLLSTVDEPLFHVSSWRSPKIRKSDVDIVEHLDLNFDVLVTSRKIQGKSPTYWSKAALED